MHAVSSMGGETPSPSPARVCPVITAFCNAWGDTLRDYDRDRLLKPLIPRLIGTNNGREMARSKMILDWLISTHACAWLRLAGLDQQADTLSGDIDILRAEVRKIIVPDEMEIITSHEWSRARAKAATAILHGTAAWSALIPYRPRESEVAWLLSADAATFASLKGIGLGDTASRMKASAFDLLEALIEA